MLLWTLVKIFLCGYIFISLWLIPRNRNLGLAVSLCLTIRYCSYYFLPFYQQFHRALVFLERCQFLLTDSDRFKIPWPSTETGLHPSSYIWVSCSLPISAFTHRVMLGLWVSPSSVVGSLNILEMRFIQHFHMYTRVGGGKLFQNGVLQGLRESENKKWEETPCPSPICLYMKPRSDQLSLEFQRLGSDMRVFFFF